MVTQHTYYLAEADRCAGDLARVFALTHELKRAYQEQSGRSEGPDTGRSGHYDGYSVWIDERNSVCACFVFRAEARRIDDPEQLKKLAALLELASPPP